MATPKIVTPVKGLNPDVNQVYPIVNSIFKQMTGRIDIEAVDTNSLVAMGQELDNLGKKDIWLNTLYKRIGRTIDGFRVYRNKMSSLARDNVEWGAMVQKITAEMPEAVSEDAVDVGLMDGQSIDQWIITNPKVHQRIFEGRDPYVFRVTIQERWLNEAFLSAGQMAAFINQIFGKIQNKIEFTNEELGRMCVANFVINLKDFQEFHLVTAYNSTVTTEKKVTTQSARHDADFLRWAVGVINNVSRKMENMSVLYNSDGFDRFTPASMQHLYVIADFMTTLETVVSYAAFNPNYVTARPDVLLPYWQASKGTTNMNDWNAITSIKGTKKDGTQCDIGNLIGVLFDHDALGTFRDKQIVRTTPVNARGLYYNTFWHEDQFWYNDMSENGVAFYLD